MIIDSERQFTPWVLDVMRHTPDPRLREIMVSLARHLLGRCVRHDEPQPAQACFSARWLSLDHTLRLGPGIARLPKPPLR